MGCSHGRNDEVGFAHGTVDKSGKNVVERGSQIWVFVKGEILIRKNIGESSSIFNLIGVCLNTSRRTHYILCYERNRVQYFVCNSKNYLNTNQK